EPEEPDNGFTACLQRLSERAAGEGLGESIGVLRELQYQPRVIELDRSQPEFRQSFAAYLRNRVTPARVATGRMMLASYPDFFSRMQRETGVPGRYLVAFWGLETNFGGYLGTMPTLDVLATLACDERRSEFFTAELITALRLVERDGLEPERMRGSWAGAMGHTQFMPSTWIEHAVDGDGDGRIDLWGSERDALASGAHYLEALGWQAGERWGREVRVPDGHDYRESGLDFRLPLAAWRDRGLRRADGGPLPVADLEAALLVPMGHEGPKFLVYRNFDVIMSWNRSQSYAIAVGHLADRIAGGGRLRATLPEVETAPSRSQILRLQRRLAELGHDPGEPDGFIGPATRSALRAFQHEAGLVADGYPDSGTLAALEIESENR
ncbi:MAG: lytic murein transglycosylase, partial [Wenzhouxiangellaceae bacterium]|nr:lytic murein transglycosylase [Wenzhouxiangellaceae bacterium]